MIDKHHPKKVTCLLIIKHGSCKLFLDSMFQLSHQVLKEFQELYCISYDELFG